MADVYTYVVNTGLIMQTAGVINTQVQAEYISAFGSDLNLTNPNTPQGILIRTETLARVAVADNNAALANQINPNYAGGVYLDAILALLGSARIPGTPSTVTCTITGVPGTIIPAGSLASETGTGNSNVFQTLTAVTIPAGGILYNIPLNSVLLGPIVALAGTLTTIVSNILGWLSITNPSSALPGTTEQSDVAARAQRVNTLAAQGASVAEAITSGLFAVPGVTSLTFLENPTSSPATVEHTPMVANSIYTCVAGNASTLAIAQALTSKKSAGASYNNGLGIPVSQPVTVPFSGQVITVLFDTPSIVTVQCIVTVHAYSSVSNIINNVQQAILTYVAGGISGEQGLGVGIPVSPFQLAGAVNVLVPGVFVQEVQVNVYSFTQIGTITNGSTAVTGLTYNSDIAPFVPGLSIAGYGIVSGTTVSAVVGSTGLTLSTAAVFPTFVLSGAVSSGLNTITGLASNAGIVIGMGVSDGAVNIPGGTTITGLVGTTGATMSNNATGSATENITFTPASGATTTEILTFAPPPNFQTTEIPIKEFQQGSIPNVSFITVDLV